MYFKQGVLNYEHDYIGLKPVTNPLKFPLKSLISKEANENILALKTFL